MKTKIQKTNIFWKMLLKILEPTTNIGGGLGGVQTPPAVTHT